MDNPFEIIIFYKYTRIENPEAFVRFLKKIGEEIGVLGRILVAGEGINGTVEGTKDQITAFEKQIHAQDGSEGTFGDLSDVWFKASPGTGHAFKKLKIKARKEIVTTGLGEADIDPNQVTGKHIEPSELKAWFESGEEFEILDMRNDYEYAVGHFRGSKESGMENFRDLAKITEAFEGIKDKKILTVCTYGVRCEKASGYLQTLGFTNVHQLHGGIGTYMKEYPGEDFQGSLYVFDDRMTEQFTDKYEVIGVCSSCNEKTERFGNCANTECHKQMLICESCSSTPRYCSLCG